MKLVACEQAHWDALAASLQLRLWNLNSTSSFPVAPLRQSCQIVANQRGGETSANAKKKHWKTCVKGNDVMTNVISANQPFASTFQCKFQRLKCKVSFLLPPRLQSALKSFPAGYETWKALNTESLTSGVFLLVWKENYQIRHKETVHLHLP